MPEDPDYTTYSLDELYEAKLYLNEKAYPDRYRIVKSLIAQRVARQGSHSPDGGEPDLWRVASFWQRLCAMFVDLFCIMLIFLLVNGLVPISRYGEAYSYSIMLAVIVYFHIYLVQRYGGTPGKLLLSIKITKVDRTLPGSHLASFSRSSALYC